MANLSTETLKKAIRKGRDYSQVIDLRYLDIPALQHVANIYDRDLGDKFEFIEAGSLKVSQMVGYLREVYQTDAEECSMMRVDLTGDLPGNLVPWCRDHVRVAKKQCVRDHGKTLADFGQVEISMRRAETVYWGKKPHQTRVYDKTGERIYALHKKLNQMQRDERNAITLGAHFEAEYGYPMQSQITRFERQLGARESGKAFGMDKLGEISKAVFLNPFESMEFPLQCEPAKIPKTLAGFEVEYFRGLVQRDGLTNARNAMFRAWGEKAFYRYYKRILPLLFDSGELVQGPTRERIRKAYVESTLKQLAA